MTDAEIYNLWYSKTPDHRYFRPRRWSRLKRFILKNNIKSVIEFGSGVSTLLFDSLNLNILSFETDKVYMDFVSKLCTEKVRFKLWNNKLLNIQESFDLSFVDGILPRTQQLKIAIKHSKFIAIDDYIANSEKQIDLLLSNFTRVDLSAAPLGIFIPKETVND
jgi:hypothetical protein